MAPSLQIGIMMETVQASDVVGADILGNLSTKYLSEVSQLGDFSKYESHAMDMIFHWIATTLEPTRMTPNVSVNPTTTYDDCPRDLDILLIGGPLPSHRPEQADRFMREAWEKTKTVMTTCIGGMWLASTGLLDGKKATTNRGVLDVAKKMYPKVEWQDQRWVVDCDGKLWTSGGAGSGEYSLR
ncbi:class I glutamine amidotransferase-like protein [Myriangium duriaei CBS 260.36]|uniref:Class I glutamine amidotransferase-like protein n=1 Tax=Myriangium duriaei CBS 260.36 TaxID=1168546 RepID=A0A9P4J519_9PEZI|nr:class I glutamine amidotransferase-like protein [Myriangium duriaei CBS 260.36]